MKDARFFIYIESLMYGTATYDSWAPELFGIPPIESYEGICGIFTYQR